MRSRIAITLMLVLGFGFSSAGVGMAVQGVAAQDTSAADAQYDTVDQQPLVPAPDRNEVQDETDEGVAPERGNGVAPEGGSGVGGEDVAGQADEQVAGEQASQETRQLGAEQGGQEELPFTGFAAIPVLLMGFALLSAGFVLRRRA